MTSVRLVQIVTVPQTLGFLRGQAGHFRKRGVEVIAVSSAGPELARHAADEGVPVMAIPMTRSFTPVRDLWSLWRLVRTLQVLKPDVVHANTPKAGLLGTIAAVAARVPGRVYHLRGLPLETLTGWRRLVSLVSERIACRLAHRVFCVSHSLRERALGLGLAPPEKIVVFLSGSSNGVDARGRFAPEPADSELRERFRAAHRIPSDAVLVTAVGRICSSKGIGDLARAWALIRERATHAILLLVGEVETREPVDESTMTALGQDSRVRLIGPLARVRDAYASSDLVVHPAHREGFPNVPLEAAAMRLPVITTTATGCRDAVLDGRTGTIVPLGDASAMSVAMLRYIESPELRRVHGEGGRERVLSDFVPEEIWDAMLAEFERLSRRRSGVGKTPQ